MVKNTYVNCGEEILRRVKFFVPFYGFMSAEAVQNGLVLTI